MILEEIRNGFILHTNLTEVAVLGGVLSTIFMSYKMGILSTDMENY
jgi:hypothetical protein